VFEHRTRIGSRCRDRLFAKHVQPVFKRCMRDRGVVARRRCDVDKIDALGLARQQGLGIRVDPRVRQRLTRLLPAQCADVGDGHDVKRIAVREICRNVPVLGDESKTNQSTLKRRRHS